MAAITIKGVGDFHVNPDYFLQLLFDEYPIQGVKMSKEVFRKADAKVFAKTAAVVEIPFTGTMPHDGARHAVSVHHGAPAMRSASSGTLLCERSEI